MNCRYAAIMTACLIIGTRCFSVLHKIYHDHILYGHCYKNITDITTIMQCSSYCLFDCLCLSFQLCGNVCQLCSSNAVLSPKDMRENKKCTSYHFYAKEEETRSDQSCYDNPGCCATSRPCLNGGECYPANFPRRYRCACQGGYQGDRCETPIRSCGDHARANNGTVIAAGEYVIIQDGGEKLRVFCDFDQNVAWTLVQSYDIRNANTFKYKPLFADLPYNNLQPSWGAYRLSRTQMTAINQGSTRWRITCNYDTEGVVYTDYMTGLKSNADIIELTVWNGCVNVDYIDLRGENCSNCSVCLWQNDGYLLHIDSYQTPDTCECDFQPAKGIPCSGGWGEDNFGVYSCKNKDHRCSATLESTTQTWLGSDTD